MLQNKYIKYEKGQTMLVNELTKEDKLTKEPIRRRGALLTSLCSALNGKSSLLTYDFRQHPS